MSHPLQFPNGSLGVGRAEDAIAGNQYISACIQQGLRVVNIHTTIDLYEGC